MLSAAELKSKLKRARQRTKSTAAKFLQVYVDSCYELAVATGMGFLEWVGKVYIAIKGAL